LPPAAAARLGDITADVPPASSKLWIPTVTPPRLQTTGDVRAGDLPFYSALGSPPAWRESYADDTYAGDWTDHVKGAPVEHLCSDTRIDAPYPDLVVVMTTHQHGARIRSLTVDYTADGRAYRLRTRWMMILCGDAAPLRTVCQTS